MLILNRITAKMPIWTTMSRENQNTLLMRKRNIFFMLHRLSRGMPNDYIQVL